MNLVILHCYCLPKLLFSASTVDSTLNNYFLHQVVYPRGHWPNFFKSFFKPVVFIVLILSCCLICSVFMLSSSNCFLALSDPTHPYISSFLTTCLPYCDLHKPIMSSAGDKEWTVNVFVSSSEESNKTYLYNIENGK